MYKSHDRKQLIAAGQTGLLGHNDNGYGLGATTELPDSRPQRHDMQYVQAQIVETQGMDARELPGQA